MNHFDLIIVGGGSSALMAAYKAGQADLKIAVLEKSQVIGYKLRIAGGGKSNISNLNLTPEHYVSSNKNYVKKVLDFFNSQACLNFLQEMDFPTEERKLGQIFGLDPAVNLINNILAKTNNCTFFTKQKVIDIQKKQDTFTVHTEQETFNSKYLLIATGSNAYLDEDTAMLSQITKLGHKIIPFQPALVPLIMETNWLLTGLEGISVKVKVSCENTNFIDDLLFTHKGISGPAILKISCYWQKNQNLIIDFLVEHKIQDLLNTKEYSKLLLKNLLQKFLPERLVLKLVPYELQDKKVAELSKKDRQELAAFIHEFTVTPIRNEGMKRAEVAKGGVDLQNIYAKNLESKIIENLYFAGEVLDITGILGGYNLHFAFASASLVAFDIIKKEKLK